MERVLSFLQSTSPFYIATCADNQPMIRPFGFFTVLDGKLTFATSRYGRCRAQLTANPIFELSAADMKTYRWLRVRASAEEVTDREKKEAVIASNPNLAAFRGADNMFIFSIASGTAVISSLAPGVEPIQIAL